MKGVVLYLRDTGSIWLVRWGGRHRGALTEGHWVLPFLPLSRAKELDGSHSGLEIRAQSLPAECRVKEHSHNDKDHRRFMAENSTSSHRAALLSGGTAAGPGAPPAQGPCLGLGVPLLADGSLGVGEELCS